jgi:hypothetical protein
MDEMSKYCKAYRAEQLRQYPHWRESIPPAVVPRSGAAAVAESKSADASSSYFYLHDDFTVTSGVFREQKVAFDNVTEEWKEFCKNVLHFEVPTSSINS